MIKKVISGGQVGADQAGLLMAKISGIPTGGAAPPGFMTSKGPQPHLLQSYGLVEGESDPKTYPKRTIKNVIDSDGTLWVGKTGSPGEKLTLGTCKRLGKPAKINPSPHEFLEWIKEHNIKILNVAGNTKGTYAQTYMLLIKALA